MIFWIHAYWEPILRREITTIETNLLKYLPHSKLSATNILYI